MTNPKGYFDENDLFVEEQHSVQVVNSNRFMVKAKPER